VASCDGANLMKPYTVIKGEQFTYEKPIETINSKLLTCIVCGDIIETNEPRWMNWTLFAHIRCGNKVIGTLPEEARR
jgi:hypothetical protein